MRFKCGGVWVWCLLSVAVVVVVVVFDAKRAMALVGVDGSLEILLLFL